MDLKLEGRKVLVLGASSGIGRGIAEVFIQERAQVGLVSRTEKALVEAQKSMGAAFAFPTDLSQAGRTTEVVNRAISQMKGLDVLVINTGGPPKGGIEQISGEQWQMGFQSLWISAVEGINAALPEMKKKKWGRILIVTSLSAKEPLKGMSISNGLRAGLSGLIKSISTEIAPFGVTINAILPGYTDTERLRELNIPKETMVAQIPAGRLCTTQELGALAAFLSSEQSGYITGQSILSDGGVTKGF